MLRRASYDAPDGSSPCSSSCTTNEFRRPRCYEHLGPRTCGTPARVVPRRDAQRASAYAMTRDEVREGHEFPRSGMEASLKSRSGGTAHTHGARSGSSREREEPRVATDRLALSMALFRWRGTRRCAVRRPGMLRGRKRRWEGRESTFDRFGSGERRSSRNW